VVGSIWITAWETTARNLLPMTGYVKPAWSVHDLLLTSSLFSGNYSTSCTDCGISHEKKTLTLTCACQSPESDYKTSSLDLSTSHLAMFRILSSCLVNQRPQTPPSTTTTEALAALATWATSRSTTAPSRASQHRNSSDGP
jgi:hypothetical protein